MTLRAPAAIAVGLSLIILPVIIVQAQAEGDTEPPAETDVVVDAPSDTTAEQAPEESEAAVASEEEGSVLGAETSTETQSSEGETSGNSEAASTSDESAAPAASDESASTTPADFLTLDTASSTASSTEPVEDPPAVPYEEPFVLQPAVTLHVEGSSISADIELENLTCKSCEKVLPAAQVKAYYTAWYENDGPDVKEVGEHFAEQEISVSDVALWSSRSTSWSAADIAPGRYYFVIVVDPEDAIGAYRMQRMEFAI